MINILESDSVVKTFNNKLILSDVYLKCETGEVIGLLGRNGSGKSTLLKIIFGILSADNKFIRINGKIIHRTSDLLNLISYLHQNNFIPNNLSVTKAIELSLETSKMESFYDDDMIRKVKYKKIKQLSGGELRYLEIKLVLFKESLFALLDEPYNGLAPIMIDRINELIVENSSRKGIIITDHDYNNVLKVSTRLILMDDGRTHHIKDRNELVDKGYLGAGMLTL